MSEAQRISLSGESELSAAIRAADATGRPLEVDTGGVVYELTIRRASPNDRCGERANSTEGRSSPIIVTPLEFFEAAMRRPDISEALRRLAQ